MQETIIDLIRHGEPVGGQRLRGAQDDPLSELGWQQMRDSVGDMSAWQHLVTSPLSRCREFATELGGRLSIEPEINADFREIHFGIWEGLTTKELMAKDPTALQRYWQDPDKHTPEGGEGMSEFVARVHMAWEALVDTQENRHALLVCHGGVIRAILTHVLGMPIENLWNFDVPYANASRVVYHRFPDGTRTAQLRFHQARF